MSKNQNQFCNNCGKIGHLFHQCKIPITSIGVIAFRINSINDTIQYLLIRRKDTLGFIDFLRGKYSLNNKEYIKNYHIFNDLKYIYKTTLYVFQNMAL